MRVDAAVAARIVLLRDLAGRPRGPALEVLSEDEVEVLVCRFGKGMKPSELTIGQAVLWIGRLGVHLNGKRDGMFGGRTLWRGLSCLPCCRWCGQKTTRIVVGNGQISTRGTACSMT